MKLNKKQLGEIHKFAVKIQPVYELLDWKWHDGIPTVRRIEKCLQSLAKGFTKDISSSSTGGLFIEKEVDEDYTAIKFGFYCDEYLK